MVIDFDASTHTYTVDGMVYASVTQVIGGAGMYGDAVRWYDEYSRDLGDKVHKTIALYHDGRLDPIEVDDVIEPYLDGWIKFLTDSKYQPMSGGVEVRLADSFIRTAGTADSIGCYEGRAAILDIKTGAPHPATGIQLAGYEYLYLADHDGSCRRIAVHLKADGKYRLVEYRDRHDKETFLSAVRIHHWKKENLKEKRT